MEFSDSRFKDFICWGKGPIPAKYVDEAMKAIALDLATYAMLPNTTHSVMKRVTAKVEGGRIAVERAVREHIAADRVRLELRTVKGLVIDEETGEPDHEEEVTSVRIFANPSLSEWWLKQIDGSPSTESTTESSAEDDLPPLTGVENNVLNCLYGNRGHYVKQHDIASDAKLGKEAVKASVERLASLGYIELKPGHPRLGWTITPDGKCRVMHTLSLKK